MKRKSRPGSPNANPAPPASVSPAKTEGETPAPAPDLANVCRILAAQVGVLDEIFRHSHHLASQAREPKSSESSAVEDQQKQSATDTYERLTRLALRAQTQAARTAAVLGRLMQLPQAVPEAGAGPAKAPLPAREHELELRECPRHPYYGGSGVPEDQLPSKTLRIKTPPDSVLAEFFSLAAESESTASFLNSLLVDPTRWQPGGPGFNGLMPAQAAAA